MTGGERRRRTVGTLGKLDKSFEAITRDGGHSLGAGPHRSDRFGRKRVVDILDVDLQVVRIRIRGCTHGHQDGTNQELVQECSDIRFRRKGDEDAQPHPLVLDRLGETHIERSYVIGQQILLVVDEHGREGETDVGRTGLSSAMMAQSSSTIACTSEELSRSRRSGRTSLTNRVEGAR